MTAEINKKDIEGATKELLSQTTTSISSNSLKLTVYIISEASNASSLFVIGDNSYQLYKEVALLTNKRCVYEDLFYDNKIYPVELNKNSERESWRVEQQVATGKDELVFCEEIPNKMNTHVKKSTGAEKEIRLGDKINKSKLIADIIELGYSKVDTTRFPGDISSRGGVVDVFSITDNNPTRIDFFGERVDSIRLFNPTSQLSIKRLESSKIGSRNKNLRSVKSITYEFFLAKHNYKTIYVKSNNDSYKISNSASKGIENEYKINTKKLSALDPDQGKESIEMITVNGLEELKNMGDEVVLSKDIKNMFEYEQISRCLMIKYPKIQKNNTVQQKKDKTDNVHNYRWGDYITHEDFGVGVYRGIKTKNSNDYIKIEYKNNSTVLVSVHKIYKVCPYVGVPRPEINTTNSKTWLNKIEKTKARVKKIIEEMVIVNRNRDLTRINKTKRDDLIEDELEKSFPYIETPDQKNAISDVYKDLALPGLMDRLIIGDVGFGKTEVAIRAAVRSVVSGGFVMVIVPTTILADQHYISFRGRLENLGIKVEMISRFVTAKHKNEICKSIVNNSVDILVGTHAVLSENIPKNRLSLIVIDEEHKFGVSHKNKLLKLRRAIDILTLSATPIPRTLQQSLLGVRDVSLIQTPPINRLPIKTRVLYKRWDHIYTLIKKEFLRDGQVYFLHNRVETLPVLFERLRLMFPKTKIAMAHGKMPSNDLERVVLSFFSGDVKMLVCTSIVESGLDVSNANTIIINNAHLFGLSQLYQIRGRVGRARRQAYCYLTIPDISTLTDEAIQRLRAIESSVELGSGYNIALKDLEIRGSGNLFGYEQSGSIDKVGYHLYCKMFEQALQKSKGDEGLLTSLQIRSFFNACFNAEYMPLSEDRIYYYQRIASSFTVYELDALEVEVIDRFGQLVDDAKNIFLLAKLRILYTKSLVSKIDINKNSLVFSFQKNDAVSINSYLDNVFLKLSGATVEHVFKQPSDNLLLIDIVVGKNNDSVSLAFNCVDYFIYNKKNC